MTEKVFAFDLGKASIGICARDGNKLLELKSLIIPRDFAMTSDFRSRRRAFRTRIAHKKREDWLNKIWLRNGLEIINPKDWRITKEFSKKNEQIIYNSACLRIALLQEKSLEPWQIYKALRSAIQHRGYDKDCAWAKNLKNGNNENPSEQADNEENQKGISEYQDELNTFIKKSEFFYPCYYEAFLMGLWNPESPNDLNLQINHLTKNVRQKGRVAPRNLVEKELRALYLQAQKQLIQLQKTTVGEFLYGPSKEAYASIKNPKYFSLRGSEWDAQGVLSQKIPRFDNRLMSKCRLLPLRNTCNAKDQLNLEFGLLMKLKNLRFTDSDGVHQRSLTAEELKNMFEELKSNLDSPNITITKLKKALKQVIGDFYDVNMFGGDWKFSKSGRSSFCRPALKIVCEILLNGINPCEFNYSKYIQSSSNENHNNQITEEELAKMFDRLPKQWSNFSIQDNRYEFLDASREDREAEINKTIGSINNPIVRNRLQFFYNNLKKLERDYGKPNKVILEFVRGKDSLQGGKNSKQFEKLIKENEKINDEKASRLKDCNIKVSKKNIEKLKLHDEQNGTCPYTGQALVGSSLDNYEVDHIAPMSGNISADSFYNKVLCLASANQAKGNRTPYEWLSNNPDAWKEFQSRIESMKLGTRKKKILLSATAREDVDSYNGLAETAYMARMCQKIVSLYFNWGLQTEGDTRNIYVCSGKETAAIRNKYKLNNLLLSDEDRSNLDREAVIKKNRENKLHHALDAYCISYSQSIKFDKSKNHFENELDKWYCQGLDESLPEFKELFSKTYPKYIRRNTKELDPNETIYGLKSKPNSKNGKTEYYITVRKDIIKYLTEKKSTKEIEKRIKKLWDEDLSDDLENNLKIISSSDSWFENWVSFLNQYHHPIRQSKIRKVIIVESKHEEYQLDRNGRKYIEKYKDYGKPGATLGQFKRTKMHQGQFIYFDKKNRAKVMAIYGHQSLKALLEEISENDMKLYKQGMKFFSGCDLLIPEDFQGEKKRIYPQGIYKLNSMESSGKTKILNKNGQEIETHVKHLIASGFQAIEKV
jgi:CRISPR-associated endonuclease Csn1